MHSGLFENEIGLGVLWLSTQEHVSCKNGKSTKRISVTISLSSRCCLGFLQGDVCGAQDWSSTGPISFSKYVIIPLKKRAPDGE